MQTTVNQRIRELIESLKMNKNSFSKAIGTNPQTIQNIVGGRENNPSYELLSKILATFDEVNAKWLMDGEGEMFLNLEKQESEDKAFDYVAFLEGQVSQLSDQNKKLIELLHLKEQTLAK